MKKHLCFLFLALLLCIGCTAAPSDPDEPQPTAAPTEEPALTAYTFSDGNATWEAVEQVLLAHPTIRTLDLTGSGLDIAKNADALAALDLEWIRFSATLGGVGVTESDTSFCPTELPAAESLEILQLMPALTSIDLKGIDCDPDLIGRIAALCPQAEIDWQIDLYGIIVGPDTESLNYNGIPLASLEPFYRVLPLLTKLTSLEMCGCGISNEDMDALRTAFPQAGIVWSIETEHWTVRTDIDHFATWRIIETDENGKILYAVGINHNTNEDLAWLKYCRDLVALDVGHNVLTDCEFVRFMPKLEYLILADNRIEDISPVAELKKLRYLEIFANPVSDLSPLSSLDRLVDLNMCGCYISDFSPLYGLPLERVWMTPYVLPDKQAAREAFAEQLPNCELQYVVDKDFTGYGWRYHDRYAELRYALGRAKP